MTQGATVQNILTNYLARLPFVGRAARRILGAGSSVFMFHRVLPQGEECYDPEMAISKEAFGEILGWLRANFRVVSLDELVRRRGESLDQKRPACAITFDDGWVDNFVHAFPLLRERGLPATIFLPSQFIGTKRRFWQDRLWLCTRQLESTEYRQAAIETAAHHFPWFPLAPDTLASSRRLKRFLMTRPTEEAEEFVEYLAESARLSAEMSDRAFLNWDEILTMRDSGISFGSHTLNHVLLTHMQPAHAESEIRKSRRELQEHLDSEISCFSYPWGAENSLIREIVKRAGYSYAVGTFPGLIQDNADPCLLPRIASNSLVRSGDNFNSEKCFLYCSKEVLLARRRARAKQGFAGAKRIRIAFVIDQISEWEGGTERQLHALISSLDRRYFDPQLCFLVRAPEFPTETLPCEAQWVCPNANRIPPLPVRLFRLALILKKMRPHIVHTFFIEGIFAGIVASRLAGVPRIVGSVRNAGHWKRTRHHIAFRTVVHLAHQWQCNSRTLWEYTNKKERACADRIEISPNGIDLSRFYPVTNEERFAMRRKLRLNERATIFVSVAALTPVKDLRTLLDAVSYVRQQLGSAQFLILGDGPLRSDLEQRTEMLGLNGMVKFLGRQADVRPYLAAADLGVLTSRSEGSSNSILEYMAMGLPSVLSDIAANRELVNGLFFAPGDAGDLARKLLLICKDLALRANLRSEYLRGTSEYSSEKFVLRVQSYYNKLAAGVT
jgi:glycosyltransferase involved in cell wall biosynthesis/peptidoglycan/xylan/chitin deacetylase (PgdA/CDA1 family)